MRTRLQRALLGVAGAVTAVALVVPGAAMAKGPGGGGGGGGGGHTPGEVSHSLSVPAVFVGTNPFSLPCDAGDTVEPTSQAPSGTPLSGYELSPLDFYYVQGIHTWRAGCLQGLTAATADAEWGDNLAGDAKLKVGSPIRVEIGLLADETMPLPDLTGWEVVKLEPSELDRLAAYGTLATETDVPGVFTSNPVSPYPETRIWAAGSTLTITGDDYSLDEEATAEVNATGRVVYGYNLRVPAMGDYTITYHFPGVDIVSTDAGVVIDGVDGDSVQLTITVGSGGGGGGGGGNRPW